MNKWGEQIVLVLLIGVIFYLILRNWFSFSMLVQWLNPSSQDMEEEIRGEVPNLLRNRGYEVVRAKEKTPIAIEVDGSAYESRLYADYIARMDQEWYIVIVEKERKPLRWSGPALRDYFLPVYLLYHPHGILYVQKEKGNIKTIQFDFPDQTLTKSNSNWFIFLITGFVVGVLVCLQFV